MMEAWLAVLTRHGWATPLNECSWTTSGEDVTRDEVRVSGQVISRRSKEQGINVLGAIVCANNRFGRELTERVNKAWACFAKHRELLTSNAALSIRLRFLEEVVGG